MNQTYAQLLEHMSGALLRATGPPSSGGGGGVGGLLDMLLGGGGGQSMGGQTPVLCCDKQIDLYSTPLSI